MKQAFSYFKENFKFIYSLVLIVFIPAIIIVYGFLDVKNTQKQMDNELKSKAMTIESIFSSNVSETLSSAADTQQLVDKAVMAAPEINELTVLTPETNGFKVIASSNSKNLSLTFASQTYTKSWINEESIATLTKDTAVGADQRFWMVSGPIKDQNLQKQGLAVLKMSLSEPDQATKQKISQSLIILAATVFLVLLLLINHFRFYEYAVSFKSLKEIDQMKDDFISIASHEMKTPMAAIKGYLSMINEGVAGKIDQKAKNHLDKVNANVRRLDTLVNELLDVSRLEQQRVQFDMQPVDMSEIVKNTLAELKVKADEKGLYLKFQELPAPHPRVFADPERLTQILDNLVGNAIKYTETGGVEIVHETSGGNLYTIVRDTGIGIAEGDQKQLFEKFYRVQNRKTMDIPGTGLGLWITREMVQRMNGRISVESKEGVGSKFSVGFSTIKEK